MWKRKEITYAKRVCGLKKKCEKKLKDKLLVYLVCFMVIYKKEE